jgi:hypothetical protein
MRPRARFSFGFLDPNRLIEDAMRPLPSSARIALQIALAASLLAGCGATSDSTQGTKVPGPAIKVLSNRADLISGGDALVEIVGAGGPVALNGTDVTSAFMARPDGRFLGVVTGLSPGANTLTAAGQAITIVNHAVGGPVFSGPQIQPWTCFEGALDAQCNRDPVYTYQYMPADGGGFAAYDPENPPSDVGTTTTDEGKTVPYIVRIETGAIARDEYKIATLFDPSKPWDPRLPQDGYNRKLLITHGASCDISFTQASAPDVMNEAALARGFAVMSHALNNSGHNCNLVTQAEAMIMTKEHLIDHYGEIRYTIGSGCSGGALAQYQTANAYPGLYQGITPACSFPDTWTGRMLYEDYSLLRRYFEAPNTWDPGITWNSEEIEAVWGHPNPVNATVYNTAIGPVQDPSRSCSGLTADQVYDPVNNPGGVRCSTQDYMVNIFGRRPPELWGPIEQQLGYGFANRPWDTTGVRYGFKALMAGKITPAQFVDVNSKVGGRDIDYEPQAERTVAQPLELARAYRSGAFNTASNLNQVAIIDIRGPDPGAFHDVYRTYAMRARLEREHGTSANQLLWRGNIVLLADVTYTDAAILAMDQWLTAVEADTRDVPLAQKIIEDRPADVTDRCTNGSGTDVPASECDAVVQSYSTARIEAGMPYTDDVAKCQKKPLLPSEFYPVFFTEDQWTRLEAAFPEGICDYGAPAVSYQKTVPWLTYAGGPGGEPLGPPPQSSAR